MTLKDIAEKAGVSMMTVSNVINGKHNRVSPATIERINAIVKECNYVPNLSARSLTAKSSRIIGLIVPIAPHEKSSTGHFDNPYASALLGVIERELRQHGYFVMIRAVQNQEDISVLLRNWNVDGVIFLYSRLGEHFATSIDSIVKETKLPIVIFDGRISNPNVITVCSNDKKGCYLSTKYLLNRGHKNIAFVADYRGNPLLTERFLGYQEAMTESGQGFHTDYVFHYPPTYDGGIEAGQAIAGSSLSLTGVIATADICAVGIMEGARLGGVRVPADLSVIGYDNLAIATYTTPKLTTISQNVIKKAETAMRLLVEKLQTGTVKTPHIEMDVELIERQSVSYLDS